MIGWLKRLFRKREAPPPPQVERRPMMHWVPNEEGTAFCGQREPERFTLVVATLRAVRDACPVCRDAGGRAAMIHRLTTR